MFRRTNTKLEKNDESKEDSEQKSIKNDLTGGFGKFLGFNKNQENNDSSESKKSDVDERREVKSRTVVTNVENDDKISSLIRLIRTSEEKMVVPKLELSTGNFSFPLLEQLDEDPNNIKFLENLTSGSIDLLEKTVYERIAICPQHPESLEVNVRLYCPKCSSMDIEKLHLFEHRVCGYISETKNFGTGTTELECPSCKKPIKDKKRELRIPAMWYSCHSCKEKFDDVNIKMYCRKFNHDFDTNMAGTVSIPGFILKDAKSSSEHDSPLISNVKDLLQKNQFISEENYSLKGKSGHYHVIDLVSTKNNTYTIFTYILPSENTIDEDEINAKIIQILDCNPTKAVIVGHLSNRAKSIAARYDISVIDTHEKKQVLSSFSDIVENNFVLEKFENEKQIFEDEELENAKQRLEDEELESEKQRLEKQRLDEERLSQRRKLEKERLEAEKIEAKRLESEMLAEKERLESEFTSERKKLEAERLAERNRLEEELLADKQKLEAERQRLEEERNEAEQLEAERLAERKRLEEERKKVERIEAERLAERKKLESQILFERKKLEAERLAERKKLEEERFADKLILESERKRLEQERKKVESLELERQKLETERKKAEMLIAEKLEAERKRKEEERKQAEKRVMILKKLEETENQLKALKYSLDSNDEKEE